jgi:N-acetylglucosaminyldiphosphoundecaprenol N-acetyl-beta-D-mannosaminyltransferase
MNFTPSCNRIDFVEVGGWPHVKLGRQGFAELMVFDCMAARQAAFNSLPKLAFSMNGQALSLAETDKEFRTAMRAADYIQADGQSLVFASRLLHRGASLPERISTTDFFHDAARIAQKKGVKFFMLGGTAESNAQAVKQARLLYPELQIVGSRNGYFDSSDEPNICREIVESGADVLWVGLGKPKEQLFCIRNRENLRGVAWIKTCGGLFDFLSGKNVRAPKWMQKAALEWFYRMALEPRRLFWRYFTTNIHSIFIIAIRRSGSGA